MSGALVMRRQDWIVSAGLHALLLGSAALLSLSPPAEPVEHLDLTLHWSEVESATHEAMQPPPTPVPTQKPTQQPKTTPVAAVQPEPPQPSPAVPDTAPLPQALAPAAVPYATTPNQTPQATPPPAVSPQTTTVAPSAVSPDPTTERRWQAELEALLARDRHYPMQARRAGQEGTVTVEAHFAADGQLLHCVVQLGSGFRALDEAALAMVQRAADAARTRTHPGRSALLRIPIRFHLEES